MAENRFTGGFAVTGHPQVLVDEQEIRLDGDDTSSGQVNITEPFDPTKIRVETKNAQMDALIKRIKNDEIDLSPDFQRQSVWKDEAKSRLIESMLIRIPLPAFYMDASDESRWLVVDGLQRLTTIKEFIVDGSLSLTGLEFLTEYDGETFSGLPRSLQRRIEETDIVLYLIQPQTPPNVKFDIFRRINTGGEPLSLQEIRHALNQGKVTKLLPRMVSNEFKRATAQGVSPIRMDDRECALRFLAFTLHSPDDYEEDNFDLFLNNTMSKLNEMDGLKLKGYEELFKKTMECACSVFGDRAFRKQYEGVEHRYPVNKALFEAWSVNIGRLNDGERQTLIEKRDVLVDKFKDLMGSDKDFESSVSYGTGSKKNVRYRFNRIAEIIQETIND
ncbi:MAG: DUF262 domain-containing protein [Candidatus Dadabacteria bacterium]|nr:DUF262 domain-containing protein [Candidatus Dadabacteria bacterium]